ncbi:MAG: serine/threonine-protein kinase, partial [Gemmataceae bacterium]|nr:serine/threonine-protein kinase [Gemmataceae bacterium]
TVAGAALPSGDGAPPTVHPVLAHSSYLRAVAWLVARLAEALQHAHQRGVVHRDIKPSNILLGDDGQPMLLDFNLAQNLQSTLAQANATLGGTVAYMAPEHLRALATRDPALARQVDQRADIYALGMVLYEMLLGHSPFDQSASYAPLPAIIEAMAVERSRSVPSLRQGRRDIPWGLESIACRCLAPDPAQRYQQAEHLAEDLRRLVDDRPLRFAPELSWTERIRKWARRHPRLAAAGSVAAAATLLLTASAGLVVSIQGQLQAAQAQAEKAQGAQAHQRKQDFQTKTVRALCLVNTATDLQDHVREGLEVCEQALGLYHILEREDWQEHPDWTRLNETEQLNLAADARELLLLLARARVYLAPRTTDRALPQTLAAFLAPLSAGGMPLSFPATWQAAHTSWGPNAAVLQEATQSALHEALHLLNRAEAIDALPASRALWQDRAFYWQLLGDKDNADYAARHAEAIAPTNHREHYLLATTYARALRYREAIDQLNQALHLNPRHYWSWLQHGICSQELGDEAQALADFTACVVLWPDFAWGHFNRGRVLHQLGRYEEALKQYSKALACDASFVDAHLNRGLVYLDVHRSAEALADFEAAAAQGRDDVLLQGGRGMALERLGRFAEADAAFAQVWTRDPDNQPLLLGYAFAVYRRRPEAARAAFARVLTRDPRNPRALYGQAMLCAEEAPGSGHALELFNRALEVDPRFVAARRGRALVLAHRDHWDEARQEIDWCVGVEPSGVTLYAAACVYALAVAKSPEPHLAGPVANRALAFLREALARGYGQDKAMDDPDLAGIRQHTEFRRLVRPTPPGPSQ